MKRLAPTLTTAKKKNHNKKIYGYLVDYKTQEKKRNFSQQLLAQYSKILKFQKATLIISLLTIYRANYSKRNHARTKLRCTMWFWQDNKAWIVIKYKIKVKLNIG